MKQKVKDLSSLISALKPKLREYLELVGTTFTANDQSFQCPARARHANNDETPSAGFYPDDTGWHCFVCQESGDVFTAAHHLEDKPKDGLDWISENVVYLATKLNVAFETVEPTEAEKLQQRCYEMLRFVADAAHSGLKRSADAKDYVKSRGWTDETVATFQLGYCSYDKLSAVLDKHGYDHPVKQRAGLIHEQLFDQRLLFPIRNVHSQVIGFAGRTLLSKTDAKKNGTPVYVNSDSNALYKKSEVLYNIDRIKTDTVYIVEGYADVITFHQKGITNVIGLGGVAFTEDHVQLLIRRGIKTIILCLDSDEEGIKSEERILGQITRRHGLTVRVKERDTCEDPDTCLRLHDYMLTSGTKSMVEHFVERFKKSGDKTDRDKALRAILLERSPIDRERQCKQMAKELSVRMDAVLEEVDALIDQGGDAELVSVMDLVKEKQHFERQLFDYEKKAWSRGRLLGLPCSFPIFTAQMDGLQNMFYIVAGEEGTGKSAFIRSLMLGVLRANPDKVFVLYFSLDDSISKVISRLLASETKLDINSMENPRYRIELNEAYTIEERQKYISMREGALKWLHQLTAGFVIKDETTIKDIVDMEKTIKTYKELAGDRQLVVFVDSLHRMNVPKKFHESAREQAMIVSDTLKRWCTVYDVPVLATAELRKLNGGQSRRPSMDDIKEAGDFKFDAEVVMLAYNDMKAHEREPEKAKLKFSPPNSNKYYPVVEIFVAKNKSSGFGQQCLYYNFIPGCAFMWECSQDDQKYYYREAFAP